MVPMLVVMGTIFYLSSQSFSNTPLPFPGFDKIVHITIYAVLGATVLFAQSSETREKTLKSVVWVVAIATLYGLSDEFHQSFVPGRSPDVLDVLADSVGAVLICIIWYCIRRFNS